MGILAIRPIKYSDILDDPQAVSLLSGYASECAIPLIGQPIPNREMYAAMESAEAYQCFGAYDGDTLIGFAATITAMLPHYSKMIATVESIYVDPAYRKGGAGRALMAAIEGNARSMGCAAVLYSAPVGSAFEQYLSAARAYSHTSAVFCRRLA